MVSEERIIEVIDNYIRLKKKSLKYLDQRDGGDNIVGSVEWRLRERYKDDIKLLETIKNELIY